MPQQFNNPANPDIHRTTTGPEIISAMEGDRVDAFIAGIGTGGTITGTGEALKAHYGDTRIIGVEPLTSAVLSGNPPGPHKIQGIGAGFKPKVLNLEIVDDIRPVSDEDAFRFSRRLATEEGLLVGISSGAALCAAWQVAKGLGISERRGWARFDVIQPMYSLVKRQAEVEILPLARAEGLGVITYSPVGGGMLSGKYGPDKRPDGGRLMTNKEYAYGDYCCGYQSCGCGQYPTECGFTWIFRYGDSKGD